MTPLDLEDVLDVEYPGSPSWSATGDRIAATIYEDDGNVLLVAGGTEGDWTQSRYRPEAGYVTDFSWSPVGERVAVTTDVGELRLFAPIERTDRRVIDGQRSVSAPTWAPSGKHIACYVDDVPTVFDLADGSVQRLDVPPFDRFLASERMMAWDEDGARLAVTFVDRETTQVAVVSVSDDELVWRTTGLEATTMPAWLGDGRLLVVRTGEKGTVREVVAVDIETGREQTLVSQVDEKRGVVSSGPPEISPNGERIALTLPLDGWAHIHVVDTDTSERTQLTRGEFEDKGFAGSTPQWAGDDHLIFASNRRDPGQRQVFSVDVTSGDVTPMIEHEGTNVYPRPSPTGNRLAYVHAGRHRSPELRIAEVSGSDSGDDPPVTRVTESVVDDWPVEPITPEHVRIESHDGTEVDGYLLDPRDGPLPSESSNLPAVVWVHGGPMRQMRDGWHPSRSYGLAYTAHQYFAQQGIMGLLVNYRGGIGHGLEFRQAIANRYGRDEMEDVAAATEWLTNRSYVDADSVGIWGLSYGGYAVLQLLGTHPELYAMGVNLAGLADLEVFHEWACKTKFPAVQSSQDVIFGGDPWTAPDEWAAASPVNTMDQYEHPLYSFHGTGDRYVNVEQQDIIVNELLEQGKEFEAEYYPDEGHVYSKRAVWRRTLQKIEEAFDDHL